MWRRTDELIELDLTPKQIADAVQAGVRSALSRHIAQTAAEELAYRRGRITPRTRHLFMGGGR